jgi:hypothetical protein
MAKLMFALIIGLVCFNIGFAQKSEPGNAEEKKALFDLVLKDTEIAAQIKDFEGGADKLAQSIDVKKIDLNKDGIPEYFVVLNDGVLCGALANCPNWVYEKTGGDYRLLFRNIGRNVKLETTSTNKYRDLRSDGGGTAILSYITIYKYDGKMYQENQCFELRSSGKKTKKVSVNCGT